MCEGKVLFCCVLIEVFSVMWNSMVINGVWSCNGIRFGFHVYFYLFLCKIWVFWFLFQGFKVFFVCSCCEKWMLWPINDVQALRRHDFINWGHIRTFWLRICKGLLHYDKEVMYNLFMKYTHSNICTRKKHECKLKFQI